MTSGKRDWADGRPVAGQQFEYAFDDMGNRKHAGSGGNEWGTGLRYSHYTATDLNQYSQRTIPGYGEVQGSANSNATVTVNLNPAHRHGEYFRVELPVNNSTGAFWLSVTNLAVLQEGGQDIYTNWIGSLETPQSPEVFAYDGNVKGVSH